PPRRPAENPPRLPMFDVASEQADPTARRATPPLPQSTGAEVPPPWLELQRTVEDPTPALNPPPIEGPVGLEDPAAHLPEHRGISREPSQPDARFGSTGRQCATPKTPCPGR